LEDKIIKKKKLIKKKKQVSLSEPYKHMLNSQTYNLLNS